MKLSRTLPCFAELDDAYRKAGYAPLPVGPNKRPLVSDWTNKQPTLEEIQRRRNAHPVANIGLLAGTPLPNGNVVAFIDVDDDRLVRFVCEACGPVKTAKRGAKGQTIIVQADVQLRSRKLSLHGNKRPAVEMIASGGMVVIPPSLHPTGVQYEWLGPPLLDVDPTTLPVLSATRVKVVAGVLHNENTKSILDGGPEVAAHNLMLSLTSSGIAKLTDDLPWLAICLNSLFHPEYRGDTKAKTLEMLQTAAAKGLGQISGRHLDYDPGDDGPLPLGYTRDGNYALLDRSRQIVILCSSMQLLSAQYLIGLAPTWFWIEQFRTQKGFSQAAAGEAIIAACKRRGAFVPSRVRGRGIWREGAEIVVNLGGPVASSKHLYLCFEPIDLDSEKKFDTHRLLSLLEIFNWRNPQDAMLMLGWLAMAPVCGVLTWRPHCFVYGPPRSGKTTLHTIAATLLAPLVIAADGQSSEAGIRQTLGPDSLPIMLDEFESDQNGSSLRQILRLARSASSADTPVLRGTPEGKAMTFSLRTSFFFGAVNPRGMSVADQSRIVMFELLMHTNDSRRARTIATEEAHLRTTGSAWCSYMVSLAGEIALGIDQVEPFIEHADRRHRQNLSTLLGAAFVALNGRRPNADEADKLAAEFRPTVERHALEIERDDAMECLDHLLSNVVENMKIGSFIEAQTSRTHVVSPAVNNERYLENLDMILQLEGEEAGLLIRHGAPSVERVFEGTIWAGRAWQRALHKLPGAFSPHNPVHFSGSGKKSRCVGVPLALLPIRKPK